MQRIGLHRVWCNLSKTRKQRPVMLWTLWCGNGVAYIAISRRLLFCRFWRPTSFVHAGAFQTNACPFIFIYVIYSNLLLAYACTCDPRCAMQLLYADPLSTNRPNLALKDSAPFQMDPPPPCGGGCWRTRRKTWRIPHLGVTGPEGSLSQEGLLPEKALIVGMFCQLSFALACTSFACFLICMFLAPLAEVSP